MRGVDSRLLINILERAGISWITVVPSSGLDEVYETYDRRGRCFYAAREDEAVAIAAGLTLGGQRAMVLIQQTGVGNCLNTVLTLGDAYQIAFSILVAFRPIDDVIPVQRLSAVKTRDALSGLGLRDMGTITDTTAPDLLGLLLNNHRWIGFEV